MPRFFSKYITIFTLGIGSALYSLLPTSWADEVIEFDPGISVTRTDFANPAKVVAAPHGNGPRAETYEATDGGARYAVTLRADLIYRLMLVNFAAEVVGIPYIPDELVLLRRGFEGVPTISTAIGLARRSDNSWLAENARRVIQVGHDGLFFPASRRVITPPSSRNLEQLDTKQIADLIAILAFEYVFEMREYQFPEAPYLANLLITDRSVFLRDKHKSLMNVEVLDEEEAGDVWKTRDVSGRYFRYLPSAVFEFLEGEDSAATRREIIELVAERLRRFRLLLGEAGLNSEFQKLVYPWANQEGVLHTKPAQPLLDEVERRLRDVSTQVIYHLSQYGFEEDMMTEAFGEPAPEVEIRVPDFFLRENVGATTDPEVPNIRNTNPSRLLLGWAYLYFREDPETRQGIVDAWNLQLGGKLPLGDADRPFHVLIARARKALQGECANALDATGTHPSIRHTDVTVGGQVLPFRPVVRRLAK